MIDQQFEQVWASVWVFGASVLVWEELCAWEGGVWKTDFELLATRASCMWDREGLGLGVSA